LTGSLVTIDAMGCQKTIAATIIGKEADYLLALKANHPTLHTMVEEYFHALLLQGNPDTRLDYADTVEQNHGRIEVRRCWASSELTWLPQQEEWSSLHSVVMIESERHVNGLVSLEQRYYLSSASGDAMMFLNATRQHWSIENSLHWVLDVAFREDDSRIRKGHGAENFALLRHIALNLLKQEQASKIGMQNKRLKAGWDEAYLERILGGMNG
jgi:predicted transposase YbfD/YdcC